MKLTTNQMVGESLKARHDDALEKVYLQAQDVIRSHCPNLIKQYSDGLITRAEVVTMAIDILTKPNG